LDRETAIRVIKALLLSTILAVLLGIIGSIIAGEGYEGELLALFFVGGRSPPDSARKQYGGQ